MGTFRPSRSETSAAREAPVTEDCVVPSSDDGDSLELFPAEGAAPPVKRDVPDALFLAEGADPPVTRTLPEAFFLAEGVEPPVKRASPEALLLDEDAARPDKRAVLEALFPVQNVAPPVTRVVSKAVIERPTAPRSRQSRLQTAWPQLRERFHPLWSQLRERSHTLWLQLRERSHTLWPQLRERSHTLWPQLRERLHTLLPQRRERSQLERTREHRGRWVSHPSIAAFLSGAAILSSQQVVTLAFYLAIVAGASQVLPTRQPGRTEAIGAIGTPVIAAAAGSVAFAELPHPVLAMTADTSTGATSFRSEDTRGIQRVLNRYRDAFSILDVSAAKAVWPAADAAFLSSTFARVAEQNYDFDHCTIAGAMNRARASCRGVAEVRRAGSRSVQRQAREWTFRLSKARGDWRIDSVDRP